MAFSLIYPNNKYKELDDFLIIFDAGNKSMITTEVNVSFEDTSIAFGSRSDRQLRKMHLLFKAMNNARLVNIGTTLLNFSLKIRLPIKAIIKKTFFEHFCGGETIADCEHTIKELAKDHIGTILDYSVEGEKSETGFDTTMDEILKTIERAHASAELPFCVFKATGLGSIDLLEKVQKKEVLSEKEKLSFEKLKSRINVICKKSFDFKVRIFIDAEESWIQQTIDELTYQMMEIYNKDEAIVYNTFQMYRADMLKNLELAFKNAVEKKYFLGVKLVRGAYMEKERERAKKMGYPDPIQPDKASTDTDFNKALLFCMENIAHIYICAGTHNEHSNNYLISLMDKHGIKHNDPKVFFAQLYGMSDNISYNLANAGYQVAKYVPYGPIEAVMPYLIRRANENTAIAGQSSRELALIKKELERRKALKI